MEPQTNLEPQLWQLEDCSKIERVVEGVPAHPCTRAPFMRRDGFGRFVNKRFTAQCLFVPSCTCLARARAAAAASPCLSACGAPALRGAPPEASSRGRCATAHHFTPPLEAHERDERPPARPRAHTLMCAAQRTVMRLQELDGAEDGADLQPTSGIKVQYSEYIRAGEGIL